MRGLSFEQLVAIADATCARTGARIINYPTLAAAAALTSARLHGVPLYGSVAATCAGLTAQLHAWPALDRGNAGFIAVVCEVFSELTHASSTDG